MKKIIYSMLMLAATAFALTSCEDVPAPYDTPTSADSESSTESNASGDGSLENPFNSAAANELGETLSSGSSTDDYYYIQGIVYSISEEFSSSYGNATFYISADGTSTDKFYCYRVYYLNNQKWTDSDPQIEIGDSVIVYAKIMNYSGTIETAQSYGYIYYHNGTTGTAASESTGEATGSGTVDDPYNCVAANEIGSSLSTGSTSDDYYYIKGTIVSITESFTSSYGNATFYISDDGTSTDQFYCYRIYYFNNQSWTTGDTQIAVGDEVVVYAKIMNYYGTPETALYYGYLYSLNGATGSDSSSDSSSDASGSGTVDDPYNCVAANDIGNSLSQGSTTDDYYYIKGIIASISEEFSTSYGNATFYISDDGSTTNTFYCYRVYYLNGDKWTSSDPQIAVGDEVVIYAKIMNYYGTPETAQYYGYIYSHTSSGDSSSDDSSSDDSSSDSGVETTDSYASFTASGLGLDNGTEVTTVDLGDGTTVTFSVGSGTTTPKYYDNGTNIRLYPGNTATVSSSKTISSVTIECDQTSSMIYNASEDVSASPGTVSFSSEYINVTGISSTSTVITNSSTSTGSTSQVRFLSMTIYYAD